MNTLINLKDKNARNLFDYSGSIKIIDAHQHYKPEKMAFENQVDLMQLFGYCVESLNCAGLKPGMDCMNFDGMTAKERWRKIKPFWEYAKHTSYARGVKLSINELIGDDDITDRNYQKLSDIIEAENTPGFLERYCKRFNIEQMVTSNGTVDIEKHPYTPAELKWTKLVIGVIAPYSKDALQYYGIRCGKKITGAESFIDALKSFIDSNAKAPGVVGWKSTAFWMSEEHDKRSVDKTIKKMLKNERISKAEQLELNRFFYFEAYSHLRKYKLPVAVHTGVAGNFPAMDVKNFIAVFQEFRDIHFDLFHMSLPSYQDYTWCGRNNINVSLNFCWAHLVSQEMFEACMCQVLDVVATNKVIAFGGDFIFCPIAGCGSLIMARESIAKVLGERVSNRLISMEEAKKITELWFYENPKRIYKL